MARGHRRHHLFAVAGNSELLSSWEREGKKMRRPRFLPVRQMEQQQEWRDPSRRPRLGGIKLRLSLAWMTGRVDGTQSCRKLCIAQRTPQTGSGPVAVPGEARGSVGGLWDLHGQT